MAPSGFRASNVRCTCVQFHVLKYLARNIWAAGTSKQQLEHSTRPGTFCGAHQKRVNARSLHLYLFVPQVHLGVLHEISPFRGQSSSSSAASQSLNYRLPASLSLFKTHQIAVLPFHWTATDSNVAHLAALAAPLPLLHLAIPPCLPAPAHTYYMSYLHLPPLSRHHQSDAQQPPVLRPSGATREWLVAPQHRDPPVGRQSGTKSICLTLSLV